MNTVVWKFPIPVQTRARVGLPKGAQILSVGVQLGMPFLWALVDPEEIEREAVALVLLETGRPAIGALGPFLGRVELFDRQYVLHIFKESA